MFSDTLMGGNFVLPAINVHGSTTYQSISVLHGFIVASRARSILGSKLRLAVKDTWVRSLFCRLRIHDTAEFISKISSY